MPDNTIETLRKDKSLSQDEICEQLDICKKTYYNWTHGCPIPSDKLILLSHILDCSIDYLLGIKS